MTPEIKELLNEIKEVEKSTVISVNGYLPMKMEESMQRQFLLVQRQGADSQELIQKKSMLLEKR